MLLKLSLFIYAFLFFVAFSSSIQAFQWYSCPPSTNFSNENLVSKLSPKSITTEDLAHVRAFCTEIPVALSETSQDKTVSIFVKRMVYVSSEEAATGLEIPQPAAADKSLWFIPGRIPSSTSAQMEISMVNYLLQQKKPSVDVFSFDTRGTGRSQRLTCEMTQAETPGSDGGISVTPQELPHCLNELSEELGSATGGGSQLYSADAQATDVWRLIERLRSQLDLRLSTGELYLYGYGYSSVLVQRAVQIYQDTDYEKKIPNLKGLILDSPYANADDNRFDLKRFSIEYVDANFNSAGFKFLELCAKDDKCSSQFINEETFEKIHPADVVNQLFDDMYGEDKPESERWCTRLTTHFCDKCFRKILGWMLRHTEIRQLIPAFLYRLRRCDEVNNGDVTTLLNVISQWRAISKEGNDPAPFVPAIESPMLMMHLFYNELSAVPPVNNSVVQKRFDESRFVDAGNLEAVEGGQQWRSIAGLYEKSPYFNTTMSLPEGVHLLMMTGDMDPIAPPKYGQALYESIISKSQLDKSGASKSFHYLINFPTVNNFVLLNSLTRNGGNPCAVQIMQEFLEDPSDLNRGCATDLFLAPNFDGDHDLNQKIFGVDNPWEGIYESADAYPRVNLWTFVGVEGATLVFFTLVSGVLIYWIILLNLKVRKQAKLLEDGDYDDFFFSKSVGSRLVEDIL